MKNKKWCFGKNKLKFCERFIFKLDYCQTFKICNTNHTDVIKTIKFKFCITSEDKT